MNQYNHQSCNSCQKPQQTPWHQPPAQPIVCPPQYRVRDSFVPRMQPVIHPIVNVNREHIVNVPQHFYTQTTRNVVVPDIQQAYPMNNQFQPGPMNQMNPMNPMNNQFQQQQQFFPGQFR